MTGFPIELIGDPIETIGRCVKMTGCPTEGIDNPIKMIGESIPRRGKRVDGRDCKVDCLNSDIIVYAFLQKKIEID